MIPFSSYPSMTAAAQKRKIRLYIKWHRDFDTISFELMMTTFKPFLLNGIVYYSTITAGVLEMLSWEIDLYAKDFSLHIFIRRIFWEKNLRFRSWRGIGNGEMLQMDVYGVLIYRYIDPRKLG